MTYTSHFVDLDISKSSFEICLLPVGVSASFANSTEGIADCLALLRSFE